MTMQDKTGCLYMLTFPSNKIYIGITLTGLKRRINLHKSHAKTGRPGAVYNAIRKYGFDSVGIKKLVISSDWDYLADLEKKAIANFASRYPLGYNLTDGGEGTHGVRYSDEQRKKLSIRKKEEWLKLTDEEKALRFRPAGWNHTLEARKKISDAGKNAVFSKDRRDKIGKSKIGNKYNLGRIVSQETREKIAKSQIGKIVSDETRLKQSIAAKNRKGRNNG